MLEVMIKLGDTVFQSRDVNGAVWSGVFEFESKANGVSLVAGRCWRPIILPKEF
jgi:hypothetical protein